MTLEVEGESRVNPLLDPDSLETNDIGSRARLISRVDLISEGTRKQQDAGLQ